jgi:hypothetical protein
VSCYSTLPALFCMLSINCLKTRYSELNAVNAAFFRHRYVPRKKPKTRDPNFVTSAFLCFLCWLQQQSCFTFNWVRNSYLAKVNMSLFLYNCPLRASNYCTFPRITALVFKRSHFRISAETTAILTDFSLFSSASPSKCSNSTLIRHWPLPSKFSPIYYSTVSSFTYWKRRKCAVNKQFNSTIWCHVVRHVRCDPLKTSTIAKICVWVCCLRTWLYLWRASFCTHEASVMRKRNAPQQMPPLRVGRTYLLAAQSDVCLSCATDT